MKQFFRKIWKKIKPYIGYIGAFLGILIGFILLRPKNQHSQSSELQRQQDIRDEKAEEIIQKTEQISNDVDQKIENYYKNKQERRK